MRLIPLHSSILNSMEDPHDQNSFVADGRRSVVHLYDRFGARACSTFASRFGLSAGDDYAVSYSDAGYG